MSQQQQLQTPQTTPTKASSQIIHRSPFEMMGKRKNKRQKKKKT